MAQYGITLNSNRSRNNLRSPQPHTAQDQKNYKKKYQQIKQSLKVQKKLREQLQTRMQQLQNMMAKQQRQLQKKQQINDVLLQRIKCLKGALAEQQKKTQVQSSYQSRANPNKSNSSQECSIKCHNTPVVGGYFGSVFK